MSNLSASKEIITNTFNYRHSAGNKSIDLEGKEEGRLRDEGTSAPYDHS